MMARAKNPFQYYEKQGEIYISKILYGIENVNVPCKITAINGQFIDKLSTLEEIMRNKGAGETLYISMVDGDNYFSEKLVLE